MFDFGKILPEEAIAFFLSKLLLSPDEFKDLEDKAKATAFSITNLSDATELEFIHKSLLGALEEGKGFSEWKKEIANAWENNGWTEFRVKTIYQTNMHQAKAVGSWHQMQETKEALPYLRYSAIMDNQTRPSHAKMHNIILPIDDPFWEKFYPTNGFGCRCLAYAISLTRAIKLGITKANEKIGFADKGFDINPALGWASKIKELGVKKREDLEEVKNKIKKKLSVTK